MSPMRRMAHGSEHPKVRFRATRNPVQVSEVPGGRGRLAPSSAVADQFAAAAEVTCDRHALQLRSSLAKRVLGVPEQGGGTVQVEATFPTFRDCQVLQDLALQRSAQSFGILDAVVLGCCLQLRERGDAEIRIDAHHAAELERCLVPTPIEI